jgi:uncharacterized protein (DUF885 family)
MLDQAMDALAEEIVRWYAQWNPVYGTYLGIHDYDHMLPDSSLSALKEEIRRTKEFKARLQALKPEELSPARQIDRRTLLSAMDLSLFDEEVLHRSEMYPAAPGEFGTSIMLLYQREFAPLPERLQCISARFAAAPKYLGDAKERLTRPVKLWTTIGIESCSQLQGLLKMIEGIGRGALPPSDAESLADSSAKASKALNDHEKWLREDALPRATDKIGIGARDFDRLIKLRGLGLTADEIYSLGNNYLASAKKQLSILAGQIRPGSSVEDVKELVQSKHPKDFAEALSMTVKAMNEAKEFVAKRDIATFPPNEELKVIETPEYLRHVMPIAAYMPSAPFDAIQQGIYMVTPVQEDSNELKKHSYAKNWITAIHEGYPGHHLHNSCAAVNKSYARAYVWSIETVEGWALYCEEMMPEHGFHNEPEVRFSQTLDLIWRACRVIIDVDMHRRKMTFDQAVDMLMREAGLDKATAASEVKRYTYTPGYPLSYLIGKHMIMELKNQAKKELGPKYSDKLFHDTFLYAGLVPMALIKEVFEQKFKEMKSA